MSRSKIAPEPQRSSDAGAGDVEPVWLPARIPILVPGQEWRTWWDFGPRRTETDLPDHHEATIIHNDSHGKPLPNTTSALDWRQYEGRRWIRIYSMHDAAKALVNINKTMAKWQNGPRGGLSVYVRDGDAKDQQDRAFDDAQRRRLNEQ